MSEKTEKATAYKLQKAKEKGQVSKSQELTACLAMICLFSLMMVLWPRTLMAINGLLGQSLHLINRLRLNLDSIMHLQQFVMTKLLVLWLPLALVALLSVILITLAQTGFVWSFHPLIPDFKRLHLTQGFKKLFSSKLLFDAFKSLLKFSLAIVIITLGFKHDLFRFVHLLHIRPSHYPALLMSLFFKLFLELMLILLSMAVIDKLYTRWKFAKDNRMSKQDIKDEYKQREGSPLIKSKIKTLQQQLRKKTASIGQVKSADVVITNPTHLAIALHYKRDSMPAPKVLCKVQGELVQQVKSIAKRYGIPIIENKPFAQALYATVKLNQCINRELFPVAAMIFREIYDRKGQVI